MSTFTAGGITGRRKPDSVAREARLDGIYVVRKSVPAETMAPPETVQAYKDLARVERAFRCLETVDIEIRPVRHWAADRHRPPSDNGSTQSALNTNRAAKRRQRPFPMAVIPGAWPRG